MDIVPWSLPSNEDAQLVRARTRIGLALWLAVVGAMQRRGAHVRSAQGKSAKPARMHKQVRATLAGLASRRRSPEDAEAPLSPMEVTALAELAAHVWSDPRLPQRFRFLALAFDAMLPKKLARCKEVCVRYLLDLQADPKPDCPKLIRQIIAMKAAHEDRPPKRPFDPRTEGEAVLADGGWSDAAIAYLTDPDRHAWQEGDGERRVSRRLSRYRGACSRGLRKRSP